MLMHQVQRFKGGGTLFTRFHARPIRAGVSAIAPTPPAQQAGQQPPPPLRRCSRLLLLLLVRLRLRLRLLALRMVLRGQVGGWRLAISCRAGSFCRRRRKRRAMCCHRRRHRIHSLLQGLGGCRRLPLPHRCFVCRPLPGSRRCCSSARI